MGIRSNIYGDKEDFYKQFDGCVLSTFERNGYDDSDFYAVVWNDSKQMIENIEYDTTRCGGSGTAIIDATPETLRKVYRMYKKEGRCLFDSVTNEKWAKEISKGDEVEIVKGTKVKIGTKAKCFWTGEVYNRYSRRTENRIGIEVDGERIFISAENAVPVDWQSRLIHGKERKRIIKNYAVNSLPPHFRHQFTERRKINELQSA